MYLNSRTRNAMLSIYCLFMLADGDYALSEQQRFASLCEQMEVSDEKKKELEAYCLEVPIEPYSDNSVLITQKIKEILDEERQRQSLYDYPLNILGGGRLQVNEDKSLQAQALWTLINLGYADTDFSGPERKVVFSLMDHWAVDKAVAMDLWDTAETISALTKQKEWIKTTRKPYDTVHRAIEEIEKDIHVMIENTEVLIRELEIA